MAKPSEYGRLDTTGVSALPGNILMIRTIPAIVAVALIILCVVGCSVSVELTPSATRDIEATVVATVSAHLEATPTPTPIPKPVPNRLQAIPCDPLDCDLHMYGRMRGHVVEWVQGPSVTSSGVLTLSARIGGRATLVVPSDDSHTSNIVLIVRTFASGHPNSVYGFIMPPGDWDPKPGQWVADEYRYADRTLTVRAQTDSAAATHLRLQLCLWNGGRHEESVPLDCIPIRQP